MPTTGYIANPRIWATGSIASGAAQSNDIDLMGYVPTALDISSGFEGAMPLTIKGSNDATNWLALQTSSGALVGWASAVITSATAQSVAVAPEWQRALEGHRYIRFVSSANQSTGITFTVQLKPL